MLFFTYFNYSNTAAKLHIFYNNHTKPATFFRKPATFFQKPATFFRKSLPAAFLQEEALY